MRSAIGQWSHTWLTHQSVSSELERLNDKFALMMVLRLQFMIGFSMHGDYDLANTVQS